jgi:hypothetical protein
MAVKLNRTAFDHAKRLIKEGKVELDARDDWSRHQPSTDDENRFIEKHGFADYAKWHLGVDDEYAEDTKSRYSFPYGDFVKVHRCALLAAESRAGQYDHRDVQRAAAELHEQLEPGAHAA